MWTLNAERAPRRARVRYEALAEQESTICCTYWQSNLLAVVVNGKARAGGAPPPERHRPIQKFFRALQIANCSALASRRWRVGQEPAIGKVVQRRIVVKGFIPHLSLMRQCSAPFELSTPSLNIGSISSPISSLASTGRWRPSRDAFPFVWLTR